MTEPRERRPPAPFEIPDLELPPARTARSGTHSVRIDEARASSAPDTASSGVRAAVAAPSAGRVRSATPPELQTSVPEAFAYLGPTLDLGDPNFDTAAIQLEHDAQISQTGELLHYGRSASLVEDDFAPATTAAIRRSVPNVLVQSNWPSGVTPARERLLVDANDVRALANYGTPPSFALLAPLYSVRVFVRRRALVAALKELDAAVVAAEAERDALVQALGARLRPVLERDGAFARLVTGNASSLELGRAVLAARGAIDVEEERLEPLRRADERVRSLVVQAELHLRALDACEEDKVRLGNACAAALIVAAGALAVWTLLS